MVARYLEQGFDVYMIDWGDPRRRRPRPDPRGLRLPVSCREAVSSSLAQHRREDLHLLGYCMGGTLSALFAALHPGSVRTLTLLAAPIDFGGRDSLLHLWTDAKHFDVDAFVDAHGNCPAWFLQACFLVHEAGAEPPGEEPRASTSRWTSCKAIANYFAMERWINDNIPIAGETFREFVKKLYQGNELVRGTFQLGDRRDRPRRIVAPLLLLTASNDHLVAPSSTEGIRPHVGSRDIRSMTIDAGHVGLVVGGKAQQTDLARRRRGGSPSARPGRDLASRRPRREPLLAMGIRISGVGAYVPTKTVTNHELAQRVDTSHEWIVSQDRRSQERRISEPDEAPSDMGWQAALDCLEDAGVDKSVVDLIVVACATPDQSQPAVACMVQEKLGLSPSQCPAFDVNSVCAGFVFALNVAQGMMLAEPERYRHALVIGSDAFSKILNWDDRRTCVFFGDGAGAVLLSQPAGTTGASTSCWAATAGAAAASRCRPAAPACR